jgi:hypothetical protein
MVTRLFEMASYETSCLRPMTGNSGVPSLRLSPPATSIRNRRPGVSSSTRPTFRVASANGPTRVDIAENGLDLHRSELSRTKFVRFEDNICPAISPLPAETLAPLYDSS